MMEFSRDSQGIWDSFQKDIRLLPEASSINSLSVSNKSKFFIFTLFVILLSMTWMNFFHKPFKRDDISPTIQEINHNFAQFVQILSSDNISDDLQRRKNHQILGKVENTVKYFDDENVRQYFLKIDLPLEELLNSLYVLHALANQYTYDSHDGLKARKLLTYAKSFAEQYVKNNYLIRKDFAKFTKQNGHLKEKEIVSTLLHNDTELAKIKILDSIKTNKALLEDENVYIVNYQPTSQSHSTIIPKNDLFNQFYCKEVLSKHYARLIIYSDDSKDQALYLKEIQSIYLGEDKKDGLLEVVDKLTTKRISSSYNNLANILLKLYEKGICYS